MLASPKMCKSTEVIGSSLRINDLGISTLFIISIFHFSYLSLIFWGTDSSHEILDSHISLCNILIPLGHTPKLIHSKYFV